MPAVSRGAQWLVLTASTWRGGGEGGGGETVYTTVSLRSNQTTVPSEWGAPSPRTGFQSGYLPTRLGDCGTSGRGRGT